MIIIDTSALVRFFTNDDKIKANKVKNLLEKEEIFLPDIVFTELNYVLTKLYKIEKTELVKIYQFLLSQNNIKTSQEIKEALELFKTMPLSVADCLIAVCAKTEILASFDQKLIKTTKAKSYW